MSEALVAFFSLLVLWHLLMGIGMCIAAVVYVPYRIARDMLYMRWVLKGKYLW